jgi:hypothetical protein
LQLGGIGEVFSNERAGSFVYPRKTRGGVYLGIGSHQNFTHICGTRPERGVIMDVSADVTSHLAFLRTTLKLANNPLEFLALLSSVKTLTSMRQIAIKDDEQLWSAINEHILRPGLKYGKTQGPKNVAMKNLAFAAERFGSEEMCSFREFVLNNCVGVNFNFAPPRSLTDSLYVDDVNGRNIWLRSLSAYSFLHDMAVSGKIAIIEGNIADREVIKAIRKDLGRNEISAAYFSNVEKYIVSTGGSEDYYDGLRSLSWSSDPLVLRTFSYLAGRKVEPYRFQAEANNTDPFMYQALTGKAARFFDDPAPERERDAARNFLFRHAISELMRNNASYEEIYGFVFRNGGAFFDSDWVVALPLSETLVAHLDIPALTKQFQENKRI